MTTAVIETPAPAQSAKEEWLQNFDGPVLYKQITLGAPLVRGQFQRHFTHLGRNSHMISVYGRVLVGEDKVLEAEKILKKKIDAVERKITSKLAVVNVRLADAGITDEAVATLNKQVALEAPVVIPAQNDFIRILKLADAYAQRYLTLWLEGEMSNHDKANEDWEIKKLLRGIAQTADTARIMVQRQLVDSKDETQRSAGAELAKAMADIDSAPKDDDEATPGKAKALAAA